MVIPSVHHWDRFHWLHGAALTLCTAHPKCSALSAGMLLLSHAQGRQPSPVHPAYSTTREHICAPTTSHLPAAKSKQTLKCWGGRAATSHARRVMLLSQVTASPPSHWPQVAPLCHTTVGPRPSQPLADVSPTARAHPILGGKEGSVPRKVSGENTGTK